MQLKNNPSGLEGLLWSVEFQPGNSLFFEFDFARFIFSNKVFYGVLQKVVQAAARLGFGYLFQVCKYVLIQVYAVGLAFGRLVCCFGLFLYHTVIIAALFMHVKREDRDTRGLLGFESGCPFVGNVGGFDVPQRHCRAGPAPGVLQPVNRRPVPGFKGCPIVTAIMG